MATEETTLNSGTSLPPDTTEVSLAAKSGEAAPDATAASSTAPDAKPDFRDAVSDVIKKATAPSSEVDGEGKVKPADPAAPDAKAKTDVTLTAEQQAEADKALPFHNHPRWQAVMAEKKAMTEKLAAQESVVHEFNQVTEFMRNNDLQPKEVAELFRVGALLKNDPVAAREILHGVLTNLDTTIGEILPADLKAKVDDGTLDEAAAKEIARMRFQTAHGKQVSDRQQQKTQAERDAETQTRAQEAHGNLLQSMQTGVMEWESQVKINDPDYSLLAPQIEREVKLASIENPPKTAADAVNLCKVAYDKIKGEMSKFAPRRAPVAPGPKQESSSLTNASEAPKSIGEIVTRGMGLT